jgi:hypothetical protein
MLLQGGGIGVLQMNDVVIDRRKKTLLSHNLWMSSRIQSGYYQRQPKDARVCSDEVQVICSGMGQN